MLNLEPNRNSTFTEAAPLEPVDQFPEGHLVPQVSETSAGIVFRSLLMMSVVGLGATLLLYASVHSGDPQRANMGFSSRQMTMPPSSPIAATPTASLTPIPMTPVPDTASGFALTPLADVPLSVERAPKAASSVPPRPKFVALPQPIAIVRIEPDPVRTEDGKLTYSPSRWRAKAPPLASGSAGN
ncbi:MAG: hypothetical protein WBY94_12995 [Polyangiaceae bacterium]